MMIRPLEIVTLPFDCPNKGSKRSRLCKVKKEIGILSDLNWGGVTDLFGGNQPLNKFLPTPLNLSFITTLLDEKKELGISRELNWGEGWGH